MNNFFIAVIVAVLFLSGCAATQTVSEFDQTLPKTVCIAEHEAVRDGVLDALEEGFRMNGTDTKVIRAIYEEKHATWIPSIYPDETEGCDAIVFYVANWTWDVALYMYFANVWITDVSMTEKIAQATYQAGTGPDKWINARSKILELVDEMYAYSELTPLDRNPTSVVEPPPLISSSDSVDPASALQVLKDLYDQGLINESEYTAEKKEILDSL
ncbi:MAG: Sbal_3080 family lipoprotein [Pseudomonadales bacterium]